uniref:Uncharacterized protein n=1 Tax=Hordeum vulgare subsp. vulgare TaxID=112509 RepID=A0A287MHK0_HORVV
MELATGAMAPLLLKLADLLKEEYKLHKDLRKEVESLSLDLESLHGALHKVAQVPRDQLDEQVWIWAREVRKASYAMEDIVDSFLVRVDGGHDHEAEAKKTGLRRFKDKTRNMFNLKKLADRRSIAGKIQDIKNQLQAIALRRSMYRVDDIVAKPAATTLTMDDPRLLDLQRVTKLFGIEEPREKLISMLFEGEDSHGAHKEMKIVSIVGYGGLGKTTLAKAVYDKLKVKFQCVAFVPVGQYPDMKKIFLDILIGLDKEKYTNANMMILDQYQLISEIKGFLQDKRYFIVIDDIWDTPTWELITCAFVDNYLGNVVITTTRKSKVDMGGVVYTPKVLSYSDSKKLFYTKVFGKEECPEKYKSAGVYDKITEVSEKILKKCNGSPLAIATIASVLAKKPILEWSHAYNTIGFGNDEDDSQVKRTMKILSFSYYDMPLHLRACLLYLSLFPEDLFILKTMLIWMWIAEGLIHDKEGVGLFELGEIYFNDLVSRNMIMQEDTTTHKGFLNGCRVHDIVLHLLRSLSKEENFVTILDKGQHASVDSRRVSIEKLGLDKISNQAVMDMPQVRSVTAFGGLMNALPPLSSFPVLRVLKAAWNSVLEECNYLEELGSSPHLRYINLMYTRTRQLPKDIGYLKLLQVLDITGTRIEELPESMAQLQGLMCLHADRKTRMPDWLGKLTSLQELWIWPAAEKYARFVEELRKLRALRVLVTWNAPPADESVETDLLEALRSLHKIMVIDIGLRSTFPKGSVRKTCKEGFVLSLHLRRLILGGIQFSRLPGWISPLRLPNLCDLEVHVYGVEQQDMDIIGDFKYLDNLLLFMVSKKTRDKEILTCGSGAFQNLRRYHINRQVMFLHGSMPRLEDVRLQIRVCEVKRVSPDFDFDLGLLNLPAIQQVKVHIGCAFSRGVDVEEAEAALRQAVHMHPNSPTFEICRDLEEFMLLMPEEYKEKNEVLGQILIQRDRFEEIHEVIQEAKEMQGALPVNHPNLLETMPLMEHLTKDVLGPDAIKILSDDWMSLRGMLTSDVHGLEAQVAAARGHINLLNLAIQQSTPLLEEIKVALNQRQTIVSPSNLDESEDRVQVQW